MVFLPVVVSLIQLVHVCSCVHTLGICIQGLLYRSLFFTSVVPVAHDPNSPPYVVHMAVRAWELVPTSVFPPV